MPTPSQLQFLTEQAAKESDAAAQQLARAMKSLADAEAKLAMLTRYRQEYVGQLAATANRGVACVDLRNFQQFVAKVTIAIDQQTQDAERWRAVTAKAENTWREAQRRLQSYKTLAQRAAEQSRRVEERRQQKLSDEFAARSFLRAIPFTA